MREGRVHTTFNQVGTATGRLSSTNPNLQNIPIKTELGREIRAAFIAAPGRVLLSADYSQIELRLMAHFSEDPLLLQAYRNGRGHSHADGVRGLRRARRDDEQGDAQPREGGELRHRVRHLAVRAGGATEHRAARSAAVYRDVLRALRGRAAVHRSRAGGDAQRAAGAHALWPGAAHSGYPEPQSRICADLPSAPR